jgi:hypothetical protein
MPQIGEVRRKKSGGIAIFDGTTWRNPAGAAGGSDGTDTKGVQASAEQRGRINLTFDPALEAHRTMVDTENRMGNAFDANLNAVAARKVPFVGGYLARKVGGQPYQDYQSSAKAFESSMLPILSGASVTDSEAARQIEATLPQPGDSVQTLRNKARRREQMLNGASSALGAGIPFPGSRAYRGPPRPGTTGPLAGVSPLRPANGPRYPTASQRQPVRRQTSSGRNGGARIIGEVPD